MADEPTNAPATPQTAGTADPAVAPPAAEGAAPAVSGAAPEAPGSAPGPKPVSQKERERQAFLDRASRRAAKDREAAGRLAREKEEAEKRVTAERERADRAEADIARYRKSPIVAAAKDGIDVGPAISEFVSETAPEKLIREQNERIAKLEQERIEDRKRIDAERAAALEERTLFALHSVADRMIADTKAFPYTVAVWDQGQVRGHMKAIYDWSKSPDGRPVTEGEASAYIEKMAKVQYEKDEARRAHLRASAQTPPAPGTETPANAGKNAETSGNRPPRNAEASSGPSQRTPPVQTKRLSRIKQRELEEAADLAALRAATAADKKANGAPARSK